MKRKPNIPGWGRRLWSRRQQIRAYRDMIFQAKRRVRAGLPARP
jgi:hypothetical protein